MTPALAALAALAVLATGMLAAGYTVDDAYIVGRFARNLAAGSGYGLNVGRPADGLTGPLWVVPGLVATLAGGDAVLCAKVVGLACAALAAALAVRRLGRRGRGSHASVAALALLAASPSLGTWGVAGLETGAATLLLTLAFLGATRRPRAAPTHVGLAVGLLAWLRPELAAIAGVLLLLIWLRDRRAGRLAVSLAVLGAVGVLVFRLRMFGHLLPLSFDAKAGDLGQGASYALRSVLLMTSGVGVWLAWLGARSGRTTDLLMGLGLLVHVLAVMLAGGDWMPGYRLFTPALPIYASLAAIGVSRLATRRPLQAWIGLALACGLPLLDAATRLPELPGTAASQRAAADEVATWLAAETRHVALVDVGLLAYESGVTVFDLGGITDKEVARLPGGHLDKRITEAMLRARNPDALLLHSSRPPTVDAHQRLVGLAGFAVERRVAAMPWVRSQFRVARVFSYRPGYYYAALTRSQEAPREDDERDAE